MMPPNELNIKGLIIGLLLAAAVAAIKSVRMMPDGSMGFAFDEFLKDAGLVGAFGTLVGFFTRRKVVPGGQGFPGVSAAPGEDNQKKSELPTQLPPGN